MRILIWLFVACIESKHGHVQETNEFQKLRDFFNVDTEYEAFVPKRRFVQRNSGFGDNDIEGASYY